VSSHCYCCIITLKRPELHRVSSALAAIALLMAATDELTVAGGLICVEFDMYQWLTTSELWTSAGRQLREKQMKVDKREGGCKDYIFVDMLCG